MRCHSMRGRVGWNRCWQIIPSNVPGRLSPQAEILETCRDLAAHTTTRCSTSVQPQSHRQTNWILKLPHRRVCIGTNVRIQSCRSPEGVGKLQRTAPIILHCHGQRRDGNIDDICAVIAARNRRRARLANDGLEVSLPHESDVTRRRTPPPRHGGPDGNRNAVVISVGIFHQRGFDTPEARHKSDGAHHLTISTNEQAAASVRAAWTLRNPDILIENFK